MEHEEARKRIVQEHDLHHGDLALIKDRWNDEPTLAQFQCWDEKWRIGDREEWYEFAYWAFFGSDIETKPEEVEVIQRVKVVPLEDSDVS